MLRCSQPQGFHLLPEAKPCQRAAADSPLGHHRGSHVSHWPGERAVKEAMPTLQPVRNMCWTARSLWQVGYRGKSLFKKSGAALAQDTQGRSAVTIPEGVQEACGYGTDMVSGHGRDGLVVGQDDLSCLFQHSDTTLQVVQRDPFLHQGQWYQQREGGSDFQQTVWHMALSVCQ